MLSGEGEKNKVFEGGDVGLTPWEGTVRDCGRGKGQEKENDATVC